MNKPTETKVIIVHLRQPRMRDPEEMRSDPFWEFGSFGCTGCHADNLMNPERADEIQNARMAFAQGGSDGFKLVYLSPPVTIHFHGRCCEAKWQPAQMPFAYKHAPLLIDNDGKTDFPLFPGKFEGFERSTWNGKFSSAFRSRRRVLDDEIAKEIVSVFERSFKRAKKDELATTYADALPNKPPKEDDDRDATYCQCLANLGGVAVKPRSLKRPKKKC